MKKLIFEFVQRILRKGNLQLRKIRLRPMNQFLKEKYPGKPLIGIEIGVLAGENSLEMFENLNIKKLYLIDPYSSYSDYKETEMDARGQKSLNKYEQSARNRLNKYKDKIVWVKKFSSDAWKDIKEEVDFVYIDGNHQYEYVKKDIETYYPLVKKGGVFGGHDYNTFLPMEKSMQDYGVVEAVTEFLKGLKQKRKLWFYESDWWIIK